LQGEHLDTNSSKSLKNKKIGIFIIESQPPMFGELLAIIGVLDNYDVLFICIRQQNMVVNYQYAVMVWHRVLSNLATDTDLYVTYADTDFDNISVVPKEYDDAEILTCDMNTYVHLNSIGANCKLVNRPIGYRSEFYRAAYRQSKALDYLLGNLTFGVRN
jgi:hypothetical protein